jgi:hypothetical protein
MNLGTFTVTDNKFRMPCVYQFVRAGVVLYVGRSFSGLSRAFRGYSSRGFGKAAGNRRDAFNNADQVIVTVFSTAREAETEELRLIAQHTPAYNKHFVRRLSDGQRVFQSSLSKAREAKQQREQQEKAWANQGYNSLKSGLTLEQFLSGVKKWSSAWYRMRAAFNHGKDVAIAETLKGWKPVGL